MKDLLNLLAQLIVYVIICAFVITGGPLAIILIVGVLALLLAAN